MGRIKVVSRAIVFIIVFSILLLKIQSLVTPNWDWPDFTGRTNKSISGLYREENNTLNVMWLGSSHMQYGVAPMYIYELSGIRSYNLATAGQTLDLSYYRLKSALKHQNPEIVFLDASACFYTGFYNNNEARWIKAISCFHLDNLVERIEMAIDMPKQDNGKDHFSQTVSALLPIIRFHTNYMLNQKSFADLHLDKAFPQKGNVIATRVIPPPGWRSDAESDELVEEAVDTSDELEEETADTSDVDLIQRMQQAFDNNIDRLDKIVKLCRDNNCELVLTKIPVYSRTDGTNKEWVSIKPEILRQWCDGAGVTFLDLNTLDVGIDWGTDTWDKGTHLNMSGAEKVSSFYTEWLENHCAFDNSADAKVDGEWRRQLDVFHREKALFNLQMVTEIERYLDSVKRENYTVFCAVSGPASKHWDSALQEQFKEVSGSAINLKKIWRKQFNTAYASVFSNGNLIGEESGKNKAELNGELPDGIRYALTSTGVLNKKAASIKINDVEMAAAGKGICFVVYDNEMGCVVDSVIFNTRQEGCPSKHDASFLNNFRMCFLEYENQLMEKLAS